MVQFKQTYENTHEDKNNNYLEGIAPHYDVLMKSWKISARRPSTSLSRWAVGFTLTSPIPRIRKPPILGNVNLRRNPPQLFAESRRQKFLDQKKN